MILLNPTGGAICNDPMGSDYFRARRKHKDSSIYYHKGVDFLLPLGPGQKVTAIQFNTVAQIKGIIAFPKRIRIANA